MRESIAEKIRGHKGLNKTLVVAAALFAGVANGLFGGGGGMLVVPILTLLCGLPQNKAHGTAVAVILPLSLVSAIIYIVHGNFPLTAGLAAGGGVVLGGIAGALLLKRIKSAWLEYVFYALMLAAGIKMVL